MWKERKQKERTLDEIEALAQQSFQKKQGWHFHILTRDCLLNDSDSYVLILETSVNEEIFVHCCSEKPIAVSKRLSQLLHGQDIVRETFASETPQMAETAVKIINRAKELSTKGILWHHHMLFPDCIFNNHKGQWTLMLEDLENEQTLESVSDCEPLPALKEIETLFYGQT